MGMSHTLQWVVLCVNQSAFQFFPRLGRPSEEALMLSTRFGYGRPARWAARLAFALSAGDSFECPEPWGGAFFHGALRAGAFFVGLVMTCASRLRYKAKTLGCEIGIEAQHFGDAFGLHHGETDGIDQADRPPIHAEQPRDGLAVEILADPDDTQQRHDASIEIARGVKPDAMLEQRGGFHHHVVGSHQAATAPGYTTEHAEDGVMVGIRSNEERVKRGSVDEEAHRR